MNLDMVVPAQLENMLWEYDAEAAKLNIEYQLAKEEFAVLEENKKKYQAQLETEVNAKYNTEKVRAVLLSKEFDDFMIGYKAARAKAGMAKVLYDNCQRHWDTIRSLLTSKNKEWHRSANN